MMKILGLKFGNIDWLTVFLCMIWGRDLLNYANAVFLRLPVLKEFGEYASEIIIVITLLCCFRSISKHIKKGGVFFYFAWFIAYIFSYFHINNGKFLDENFAPFFLTVLPMIFVGRAIDINKLDKPFYIISVIYVLWKVVMIVFLKSAEREMGEFTEYNMSAAYNFLPHLLMVTWHFLRKFNIRDFVVTIMGVIALFGMGTRGPVLCWIVFVAFYFLFAREYKRKVLSIMLIVGLATASLTYVNSVFDQLNYITTSLGLSNRIYKHMEEDMLDSDAGRDRISKTVLQATSESGIFGLGICGDRAATLDNNYSHNLFIEMIASFGYVLGFVLIAVLILYSFFAWRCCFSQEQKGFFLVLLSFNVHLFLSSSFLQTPLFFLFLGYCSRLIYDKRLNLVLYGNTVQA